jgi:hypothetical protein
MQQLPPLPKAASAEQLHHNKAAAAEAAIAEQAVVHDYC